MLLDSSELQQGGTRCLFTNELLPHSAAFPPVHSFGPVVVALADAAQQVCTHWVKSAVSAPVGGHQEVLVASYLGSRCVVGSCTTNQEGGNTGRCPALGAAGVFM